MAVLRSSEVTAQPLSMVYRQSSNHHRMVYDLCYIQSILRETTFASETGRDAHQPTRAPVRSQTYQQPQLQRGEYL